MNETELTFIEDARLEVCKAMSLLACTDAPRIGRARDTLRHLDESMLDFYTNITITADPKRSGAANEAGPDRLEDVRMRVSGILHLIENPDMDDRRIMSRAGSLLRGLEEDLLDSSRDGEDEGTPHPHDAIREQIERFLRHYPSGRSVRKIVDFCSGCGYDPVVAEELLDEMVRCERAEHVDEIEGPETVVRLTQYASEEDCPAISEGCVERDAEEPVPVKLWLEKRNKLAEKLGNQRRETDYHLRFAHVLASADADDDGSYGPAMSDALSAASSSRFAEREIEREIAGLGYGE